MWLNQSYLSFKSLPTENESDPSNLNIDHFRASVLFKVVQANLIIHGGALLNLFDEEYYHFPDISCLWGYEVLLANR